MPMRKLFTLIFVLLVSIFGCTSSGNYNSGSINAPETPSKPAKATPTSITSQVHVSATITPPSSMEPTVSPLPLNKNPSPTLTPTVLDVNSNPSKVNDEHSGTVCRLTGGELVESGWSGKDSGLNYCNQCMGLEGMLGCTKMACPTVSIKPAEDSIQSITTTSAYPITSMVCADSLGPDCSKLRLGDDFLTTVAPAKGYLFSCTGKNPNAPGAITSKLTWLDIVNNTWDFFKKLWLPAGKFSPGPGIYTESTSAGSRSISTNNLPIDGKIGDWPMTNYSQLSEIDRNPGVPHAINMNLAYPINPNQNLSPSCVSLGAIGISKNGVVIYNAVDGRGEDAVAREIVDVFGGHPAQNTYHYHFIPERLDDVFSEDGHSGVVGYIKDGFPIHGYKGVGGIEMTNKDLDACHGHDHGTIGYHYHATIEYPYTVGCYMGEPIPNTDGQLGFQGAQGRLSRRN